MVKNNNKLYTVEMPDGKLYATEDVIEDGVIVGSTPIDRIAARYKVDGGKVTKGVDSTRSTPITEYVDTRIKCKQCDSLNNLKAVEGYPLCLSCCNSIIAGNKAYDDELQEEYWAMLLEGLKGKPTEATK